MATFVSLIRGINVGGNKAVKMDTLRRVHENMGLKNVVTLLQTGNVIFEADDTDVETLEQEIADEFEKVVGWRAAIMVRTAAEMRQINADNPFLDDPQKAPNWIVVMFLASEPDVDALEAFIESYDGPETLFLKGKELYTYYSGGIGRSQLGKYNLEKISKAAGTARNWNTVTKILNRLQ